MKITVFTGPMFSGKTTGLLIACELAAQEGKSVVVVKPNVDNRAPSVESHDGVTAERLGLPVLTKPTDWAGEDVEEYDFVGIDEAQFFSRVDMAAGALMSRGSTIVCSGLDMDSNGETFGRMGDLLSLADVVHKLHGNCTVCGELAGRTFRKLSAPTDKVLVGGSDLYESRCFKHWQEGMLEKKSWVA